MKKVFKKVSILAFCALLITGSPAMAQTPENSGTTTTRDMNDDDNDNDTGKYGLAGLLGLLGLLGLRKKDDDRHRTTSTNVNR